VLDEEIHWPLLMGYFASNNNLHIYEYRWESQNYKKQCENVMEIVILYYIIYSWTNQGSTEWQIEARKHPKTNLHWMNLLFGTNCSQRYHNSVFISTISYPSKLENTNPLINTCTITLIKKYINENINKSKETMK